MYKQSYIDVNNLTSYAFFSRYVSQINHKRHQAPMFYLRNINLKPNMRCIFQKCFSATSDILQ